MKGSVELMSVSCPTSGANADCGILVLQQFLANHYVILEYKDIMSFFVRRLAEFGLEYNRDEQIGKDLFEGALIHFLPNYEIEFYNLVHMPEQKKRVTVELINRGAKNKTEYRLALISSWDRRLNTQGAGHFVILNTLLATPADIIGALERGNYTEAVSRIGTMCQVCGIYPAKYIETVANGRKLCSKKCQI